MPFFRVGGGEREYPKHNPQKMVQVVLDVMIAAIPAQLPQPQEAISPENSKPRFQSKRKKRAEKKQTEARIRCERPASDWEGAPGKV